MMRQRPSSELVLTAAARATLDRPGRVVYAAHRLGKDAPSEWQIVATRSSVLPSAATITAAAFEGASGLIDFLLAYFQGFHKVAEAISNHDAMDYNAVTILTLASLV